MEERRQRRNWSMQVTALYDYEPEQSDELGFREGDVLRVVRVQDDGWWSGYNVETPNTIGLFPSNYVQAQRSVAPVQNTKTLVDAVTTPRPPGSSRQRIQQQSRQAPDTPELEDEDDDEVHDLRSEFRGHIGTVLQLRKNLEQAERATDAVRDARRQAEREKLRRTKNWRERAQNEVDEEGQYESVYDRRHQQQEQTPGNEEDTEDDDDESAYPQQQGHMHESAEQGAEEADVEKSTGDEEENNIHREVEAEQLNTTIEAENAAATVIARTYHRHNDIVRENHERRRRAEQRQLSEIAAVCIQRWAAHAYSRQRKRRQRELERCTARRRRERETQAATEIQKWIRLRWACFWRRRVQIEREKRSGMVVQQHEELENANQRLTEEDQNLDRRVEVEDIRNRLADVESQRQLLRRRAEEGEVQDQDRQLQQKLEERKQLQLQAADNEVQHRFEEASEQELEGDQFDVDPALPSPSAHFCSPDKPRRKVMKKEAVDLIKTLVQQQLGATLRDQDAKMDELQRMVARLQTVVRKQTAMLEDSTDQLVSLQMGQHDRKIPLPPRNNDAGSSAFLPRISVQSTVPRQPVAPSGLRAPRPVVLSKLPVLPGSAKVTHSNQSRFKRDKI
ncbi:hypothetical protein PR003_g17748 [Phytophthora rubi]|uniref:SH3 domain-containing protein n=1 Tax=Phytophthora rubi TaxID=129364 RepID=A0A6A4EML4_9STRA|nr:hypothetical protein PR003_g17748 [Phytophthora rubi]